MGMDPAASAKGRVIEENRWPDDRNGVCPPCEKIAIPMVTVKPEARMLIASPEIT